MNFFALHRSRSVHHSSSRVKASSAPKGSSSSSPGRFVVKREIGLPRPRDLEVTYTADFTDIVHELRGHIGAMRRTTAAPA